MDDIADFFCELYDTLDPEVAVRRLPAVRAGRRRERTTIGSRVADGTYDFDRARTDIAADASGDMCILHLLGIDKALKRIDPFSATVPPRSLEPLSARYAKYGRFSDQASGLLLPRAADPGRPNQEPAVLADAFASVIRVPKELLRHNRQRALPHAAQLAPDDIFPALRVGCAPVVAEVGEMSFERHEHLGTPVYRIGVKDPDAVAGRIEDILEAAAKEEIVLLVLPELTCNEDLAKKWTAAAVASVARGSKLRWLFTGTGDLRKDGRAVNSGLLIDATTGRPLVDQAKTMAFTLTEAQIESWKLPLPIEKLDEDIERGVGIYVADTGVGRLAVLICEDLAETTGPSVEAIAAFGVSHLLAPVFSEPTAPQFWEHQKAKNLATAAGTTTIVANSMVVGALQEPTATTYHAALVHSPVATAPGWGSEGGARTPTSLQVFSIRAGTPEGIRAEWLRTP